MNRHFQKLLLKVIAITILASQSPSIAQVSVMDGGKFNTKVNNSINGKCNRGSCKISGGSLGGRRKRLLFHRLSKLNTKDSRIKDIKVSIPRKKINTLILSVSGKEKAYLSKPLTLSKNIDLILISPGGITTAQGAQFINTQSLALTSKPHLRVTGSSFDATKTSAQELKNLRLTNYFNLEELAVLSQAKKISNKSGDAQYHGNIDISGPLAISGKLVVESEGDIYVYNADIKAKQGISFSNKKSFSYPGFSREVGLLIDNSELETEEGEIYIIGTAKPSAISSNGVLINSSLLKSPIVAVLGRNKNGGEYQSSGVSIIKSRVLALKKLYVNGDYKQLESGDSSDGVHVDDTILMGQDILIKGHISSKSNFSTNISGINIINKSKIYADDGLLLDGSIGRFGQVEGAVGVSVDSSKLFSSRYLGIHGSGGKGEKLSYFYGTFINKSLLSSESELMLTGKGGSTINLENSSGILVNDSRMRAHNMRLKGKGSIQPSNSKAVQLKSYNINGIVIDSSTLNTKNVSNINTTVNSIDMDGKGGRLLFHESSSHGGDDLLGIGIYSSKITSGDSADWIGRSGNPTRYGKGNTGIYIYDSKIKFYDENRQKEDTVKLLGKSKGGEEYSSGIHIRDTTIDSLSSNLILKATGTNSKVPESGLYNDGIYLSNSNVNVGNEKKGLKRNLVIDGIGGEGLDSNHGILASNSEFNVYGDTLFTGSTKSDDRITNIGVVLIDSSVKGDGVLNIQTDSEYRVYNAVLNINGPTFVNKKSYVLFIDADKNTSLIATTSGSFGNTLPDQTLEASDNSLPNQLPSKITNQLSFLRPLQISQAVRKAELESSVLIAKQLGIESVVPMNISMMQEILNSAIIKVQQETLDN